MTEIGENIFLKREPHKIVVFKRLPIVSAAGGIVGLFFLLRILGVPVLIGALVGLLLLLLFPWAYKVVEIDFTAKTFFRSYELWGWGLRRIELGEFDGHTSPVVITWIKSSDPERRSYYSIQLGEKRDLIEVCRFERKETLERLKQFLLSEEYSFCND